MHSKNSYALSENKDSGKSFLKNRSVGAVGKDIAIGAGDLGFDSRAGQIELCNKFKY